MIEASVVTTIEEDLALYERLVGSSPIYASPAEHQATPDMLVGEWELNGWRWAKPDLHGNLPGWIQYRNMLPDEALAPLPEGYERGMRS